MSYLSSGMKNPSRFITTHNAEGKAVFSDQISPVVQALAIETHPMDFFTMYTCATLPAQLSGEEDLKAYTQALISPPNITIPGGVVARMCDFPPEYISPMHRTVSLDFGIVFDGEIELILDSGETRKLSKGDVAVQRETNHAWRNVTPKGARVFFVLAAAKPLKLTNGEELAEDFGGIDTV